MANILYNRGKERILKGVLSLTSQTIKLALVTSGYIPDKDSHLNFDDVTNEVSGTGYTAGGKALANRVVTQDDINDRAEFDADDVIWTVSTITARAAVLYRDTGTPSTSPLIAYIDFGQDYSTLGEDFTIEWDTEGILYLGE